jgi:hypothetical protein
MNWSYMSHMSDKTYSPTQKKTQIPSTGFQNPNRKPAKANVGVILLIVLLACLSASAQENTKVPFTIAKNYFVRNDYSGTGTVKIESAKAFEEIFGAAALMWKNGRPTPIDFSKQYIIANILAVTDRNTELIPKSLIKDKNNNLIFDYTIKKGARMSSTMRPFLAIIVDKQYQGTIIAKSQEIAGGDI